MALLEARGLQAQYGWTKVLHGIDFAVEEGGITTMLGANGAGKTTTLRAVCGMVRTAGEEVLPRGRARRPGERLRVLGGPDAGAGPQAVRQRPQPREHHEAGGQPQEPRAAAAATRDQDQHERDRFCADRAGAARQVRRRALGAVRRAVRRGQKVDGRPETARAAGSPAAL